MKKRKSQRLAPVLQMAQLKEDEQAKSLGLAQQQMALEQQKLEELQGYQADYQQRLREVGGRGISPETLRNYHYFLSNLDAAVRQQLVNIDNLQQRLALSRQQWAEAHARRANLEKLIAKARQDEAALLDKKQQKEVDERSQHRRSTW